MLLAGFLVMFAMAAGTFIAIGVGWPGAFGCVAGLLSGVGLLIAWDRLFHLRMKKKKKSH